MTAIRPASFARYGHRPDFQIALQRLLIRSRSRRRERGANMVDLDLSCNLTKRIYVKLVRLFHQTKMPIGAS